MNYSKILQEKIINEIIPNIEEEINKLSSSQSSIDTLKELYLLKQDFKDMIEESIYIDEEESKDLLDEIEWNLLYKSAI